MQAGTAELCKTQQCVMPSGFPAFPGGFFLPAMLLPLLCLKELTCLLVTVQPHSEENLGKNINPAKIIFLRTSYTDRSTFNLDFCVSARELY